MTFNPADWLRPGINTSPWPYMKFLRAKGLSQELWTALEINGTASARHVVAEVGEDQRTVTFKLSLDSPLPVNEWSLVFGDIIHNYRSALDSLAWELTHMEGAEPAENVARQIYFPLCTTQRQWEVKVAGPLCTVPERFIRRLYQLQPLLRPSPHDSVALALHELDIQDKHKACVYASTYTHNMGTMIVELKSSQGEKVDFDPTSLRLFGPQPFIDGQKLFEVTANGAVAEASSAMNVPVFPLLTLQDGRTVELFNFLGAIQQYLEVVFDVIYKDIDVDYAGLGWR